MNFGENLKKIREQRQLNQAELAKLLGTTRQTINRYERSEREPNIRTAVMYADALGIPIEDLTGQSGKPTTVPDDGLMKQLMNDPDRLMLARWICSLNKEQLQIAVELLEAARLLPKE